MGSLKNTNRVSGLLLLGWLLTTGPTQAQQAPAAGDASLFDLQSLSAEPTEGPSQVVGTGVVNGDFQIIDPVTGFPAGWTVSAINDAGTAIDPSPFISVTTLGTNNVVSFKTGEFADGLFVGTLEQTFVVPDNAPLLSFDFTLPNVVPDTTGTGTSPFFDSFSASLESVVDFNFFDLLLVDQFGVVPDPFGTAPGVVTLGALADPVFDFTFTADLGALTGQTVTLFFDVLQEDDGFQFASPVTGNVQNLPRPLLRVPEPHTVWLLAIGVIGLLGVTSRARRRAAA